MGISACLVQACRYNLRNAQRIQDTHLFQHLAIQPPMGSVEAAILIMATVRRCLLSPLSKPAGFEAKMSRNIDFYALLAPAVAGKTFVAFDQPT